MSQTKCQCYDGASPTSESCNGIDDNCDGNIDENCVEICTVAGGRFASGVWLP